MPTLVAITRGVSPAFADCELTHLSRSPIDVDRARAQHEVYRDCLAGLGCRLVSLPADAELPDCVFIEDTALVFDELAVVTRPGAPSRRGETRVVEAALADHRALRHIAVPATLDGGDVLRVGRDVLVGVSSRTSADAVAQLAAVLAPWGYRVRGVPLTGCLHLKTAVTQVGPDQLLVNPGFVGRDELPRLELVEVDPTEPMAGNALLVGDTVVYPDAYPRTAERLAHAGVRLAMLDVSELAKAEGGVTCCSLVFEHR